MALYQIRPCSKCGADRWRLIGLVGPGRAELTCVHCATNIFLPEETNGIHGDGSAPVPPAA
jgi:hypothetical protein